MENFDKEQSLELDKEIVKADETYFEKRKAKAESKKPKDEKVTKPQVSFIAQDQFLYEEIRATDGLRFVCFDTQAGEVVGLPSEARAAGQTFAPLSGEEIELGAILLPSGVLEYGDTKTLLAQVEDYIFKYLDVSGSFRKFASYYILLSWLYDRLHTLPYLRALGDTGCGKSRFLDTVGRLCYKPTIVSGCITPAPIYRMIRRWNGTIILDEADLKNSDEYHEVITILNCGFERGRPVIRATKDNPDKLQFLPTFGPKVFATRQRFKDPALEARCLTEIMQETDRQDIPPVLTDEFYNEEGELRNKLLLFRLRNWHKINPGQSVNLNISNLEPRLKQISQAFGQVFANFDEVLEDFTSFILNHQRELIEQRASTQVGQIVEVMFSLIEYGTLDTLDTLDTPEGIRLLPISAKDISEKLGDIDVRKVGQILKTLGLKSKKTRVDGETKRLIIYDGQVLERLKRRYILTETEETCSIRSVCSKRTILNSEEEKAEEVKRQFPGAEIVDSDDIPF